MSHICLLHHASDEAAAERLADLLYFLDYDVTLHTRGEQSSAEIPVEDFSHADLLLVYWSPNAQRDSWIATQCRSLTNSDKLVVIVSKASNNAALPLMLHRGSIVRFEGSSGRMSLAKLQKLLSEIGVRTGREGLVTFVAALLRPNSESRLQALTQWTEANPEDSLTPSMRKLIAEGSTDDLHASLSELAERGMAQPSGAGKLMTGVASGLRETSESLSLRSVGIGLIAVALGSAVILPMVFGGDDENRSNAQPEKIASVTSDASELPLPDTERALPSADVTRVQSAMIDSAASDTPADEPIEVEISGDDAEPEEPFETALLIEPPSAPVFEEQELPNEAPTLDVPDPEPIILEQGDGDVESALDEDAPAEIEPIEAEGEADLTIDNAEEPPLLLPYLPDEHSAGDAFTDRLADGSGGPEMVVIPNGSFRMGSPITEKGHDPSEGPQRSVYISQEFAVGRYEVTVAEFSKFVDATGYDAGSRCRAYNNDAWDWREGNSFRRPGFRQSTRHPAACIDWFAATAYADWLSEETGSSYRLLTEAEWEYAARAGSDQPYSFGSDADAGCAFMNGSDAGSQSGMALSCEDGSTNTAPVGSYLANQFGLHDMHGNVWEWTQDSWNASHAGAPSNGAARLSGSPSERIARGGSWYSYSFWLRSASRNKFSQDDRKSDLGFRVARDL